MYYYDLTISLGGEEDLKRAEGSDGARGEFVQSSKQ